VEGEAQVLQAHQSAGEAEERPEAQAHQLAAPASPAQVLVEVRGVPTRIRGVEAGEQALLVFADLAIRLGGSPLSEHGVGRSVLKQEMLRRLVGEAGLEGMRAVKSALDPEWRMAPGVLLGVKS